MTRRFATNRVWNTSCVARQDEADDVSHRIYTVPNALSLMRLIGSGGLIGLAVAGQPEAFVLLFLVLELTDWLDGKLAIWLRQRTVLGARLDSVCDVTLYGALLFSGVWIKWSLLLAESAWVGAAVLSYAVATAVGWMKFGCMPSYHTRAAKTCWLLITVAVVCVFADWSVWPFRIAMLAVLLTNLESTLMTWLLPAWRADVPSLLHAWRSRDIRLSRSRQEPV